MIISEVSDFKKDELRHELRHEPANNFAIYINGKQWKVFKGKAATQMIHLNRHTMQI